MLRARICVTFCFGWSTLIACSPGDDGPGNRSGSGGAAGDASGGSAGDPSGGSAGDASGGQGGTGTGTGGAGGTVALDCAGPFGESRRLLSESEGTSLSSPTLSSDELELFYVAVIGEPGATEAAVQRSERSSKAEVFPPAQPVAELHSVCPTPGVVSIDLSDDGLRLYLSCNDDYRAVDPGGLWVAERSSPAAPFEVRAGSVGQVLPSLSVSHDELTIYTTGVDVSGSPAPPLQNQRAPTSAAFGASEAVPGILEALLTPDIAADGRTLYGATNGAIHRHVLNDAGEFAGPDVVLEPSADTYYGAPVMSADCGTLYYVQATGSVQELFSASR